MDIRKYDLDKVILTYKLVRVNFNSLYLKRNLSKNESTN